MSAQENQTAVKQNTKMKFTKRIPKEGSFETTEYLFGQQEWGSLEIFLHEQYSPRASLGSEVHLQEPNPHLHSKPVLGITWPRSQEWLSK
jgi:hypothetical protein